MRSLWRKWLEVAVIQRVWFGDDFAKVAMLRSGARYAFPSDGRYRKCGWPKARSPISPQPHQCHQQHLRGLLALRGTSADPKALVCFRQLPNDKALRESGRTGRCATASNPQETRRARTNKRNPRRMPNPPHRPKRLGATTVASNIGLTQIHPGTSFIHSGIDMSPVKRMGPVNT